MTSPSPYKELGYIEVLSFIMDECTLDLPCLGHVMTFWNRFNEIKDFAYCIIVCHILNVPMDELTLTLGSSSTINQFPYTSQYVLLWHQEALRVFLGKILHLFSPKWSPSTCLCKFMS